MGIDRLHSNIHSMTSMKQTARNETENQPTPKQPATMFTELHQDSNGTMDHSRSTSSRFSRHPQQPEDDNKGHRSRHTSFPPLEGRIFGLVYVFVVVIAAVVVVNFGGDGSGTNADVTAGVFVEALSTPSSADLSVDYVTTEMAPHFLIPPRKTRNDGQITSNMTLREFLIHPDGFHLGMAPSFFGFYGYFGALAAIEEELFPEIGNANNDKNINTTAMTSRLPSIIKSVAGASAGAMAAIMLAAGVSPLRAAQFCTTITLSRFADFPGLLSVFRGNRFEEIMTEFLMESSPVESLQLEDSIIPVAVSAFDIQKLKGQILSTGSMARAARASATFPGLFQPVGWIDNDSGDNYVFIDGGITDVDGLNGLKATSDASTSEQIPRRVINMVVGDFTFGIPSPSSMPPGVAASDVVSISIRNLPQCGPWAMENGLRAVEAARMALKESLDRPMFLAASGEDGHYELHIDARSFVPDL